MSFTDAVGGAVKSGLCRYLRLGDNANRFFNELSPVDLPNFNRYWRLRLCDENPADIPPTAPPFQGGQCSAFYYMIVDYNKFTFNQGCVAIAETRSSQPIAYTGPIQSAIAACTGGEDIACEQGKHNQVQVVDNNGPATVLGLGDTTCTRIVTGIRFVRADGQPDTCGDPPILPPPPFPPEGDTIDIDVTYQDIDNTTVNLSGSLTIFAPVFAPVIGGIFAPVRIDLGGIEFSGNVEVSPNFEFNFGQPDSEITGGTGEPDVEPRPPESEVPACTGGTTTTKIIGCVVIANKAGQTQTTELKRGDAPTLYVPRLASVYFCVRTRSGSSWFGPLDVKTRACYVEAPVNAISTDVRIGFEPGWTGRILPIRLPIGVPS